MSRVAGMIERNGLTVIREDHFDAGNRKYKNDYLAAERQ